VVWWDWSQSQWPTGFLQCFGTVGWVIWPVKIVPEMTYKVSSGTLSRYSLLLTLFCSCYFFYIFLPSELIDGEWPEGCPSFTYHKWGALEVHHILTEIPPLFPYFYIGSKCPKFWYHSSLEHCPFGLWKSKKNLSRTGGGCTSWYQPGGSGSPNFGPLMPIVSWDSLPYLGPQNGLQRGNDKIATTRPPIV